MLKAFVARLTNPERIYLRQIKSARAGGPQVEHLETFVEDFLDAFTGKPATERRDHLRLRPTEAQLELGKVIMGKLAPDHMLDLNTLPPYQTTEEFLSGSERFSKTPWRERDYATHEIDRACSELQTAWRLPWIKNREPLRFSLTHGFYKHIGLDYPQPYDAKFYSEMAEQLKTMLCLKNPLDRKDYVRRSPETAARSIKALPIPVVA